MSRLHYKERPVRPYRPHYGDDRPAQIDGYRVHINPDGSAVFLEGHASCPHIEWGNEIEVYCTTHGLMHIGDDPVKKKHFRKLSFIRMLERRWG